MLHRRMLLVWLCLLLAGGLAGCASQDELRPYNPMGMSGRVKPEAEKYFALAHVLWKNGETCTDPEKAVVYLDRAIAIEPEYAQAYLRRGLAYSDMSLWDEAFDDLTKSLRLAPGYDAYTYRGLVSMRMGNFIGARKDLDRAIALQSGLPRAWNFRAAVKLQEDDVTGACQDFTKGCSNGDCTGIESARRDGVCQ